MAPSAEIPPAEIPLGMPLRAHRKRVSFSEDFRRFFVSGMAALLPTLVTLWLIVKLWDFLWDNLGRHIIFGMRWIWDQGSDSGMLPFRPRAQIWMTLNEDVWWVRLLGVLLAILLVYFVGVLVGNFIGRTFYRLAERAVMRIPLIRAVYPAVKQVTDFVLNPRRGNQFAGSRVVAVQPHAREIWSIGLITGVGLKPLSEVTGDEMVTVFIPSTPTAFSGYMLVVPRKNIVELPLTVEEAMRLLISGGVIVPTKSESKATSAAQSPLAASQIEGPTSAKPQAAG